MTPSPSMLISAALLAAIAGWLPETARADVEDQLGLGAGPAALGGAVGALPIGFAALHYNPATLAVEEEEPGFAEASFALVFAYPFVTVEGVEGSDIEVAAATPGSAGVLVGTRFDLGHAVGLRGVHAALSLYSPVAHLFSYSIHPDDNVQWLMLTDRTQHIGIHAGLGLRLLPWLSLGASVRVLFDVETFNSGKISSVTGSTDPETGESVFIAETRLGEDVRVFGRAAPILGLALTPIAELRIGLTWRHPIRVDDWGWTRTSAATSLPAFGYVHRFTHYNQPHELVWSGAWELLPRRLTLSADVTWSLWSDTVSKNFDPLQGRFGNTVTPALGGRVTTAPGLDLLGGYRYVPAYFDNFGGPTNLLDNDRHVFSLGTELRFPELIDPDVPLTVRGAVRLAWLVEREERKDWRRFESDEALARNPGAPGYRHGGLVPSAQVEVMASW